MGRVVAVAATVYAAASVAAPPTLGRYATDRAARRGAVTDGAAVVVAFADGSFDWFPAGRLPDAPHRIVARRNGRAWKTTAR